MKKLTWLFISLMSICLLMTPAASHASVFETADLTVSNSFITVGDSFDVTVSVTHSNNFEMLTGFGFDVDPSSQLNNIVLNGYQIGLGYDDVGFGKYVSGLQDIFAPPNMQQAPGQTLLATLSFTALSQGSDTLEVFGAFDGWFYGLFYELTDFGVDGSIDIEVHSQGGGDVGEVPIPAPILLLGTGLCGLGVFRRKIKA